MEQALALIQGTDLRLSPCYTAAMGQEINSHSFQPADFARFKHCLQRETAQLSEWFAHGRLSSHGNVAGFELECWLVDGQGKPLPCNQAVLDHARDPLLSPELARFNIELNVAPQRLQANGLRKLLDEIVTVWTRTQRHAASCNAQLMAIGILPTVSAADLNLQNISNYERYHALNEQVLRARADRPLQLDIVGHQHLKTVHQDVMLESAATSFQLHLQVPLAQAMRYYNQAMVLSAPLVAISANSPYLFGKDLWDETRIPLFEQAVAVGGFDGAAFGPIHRVTFGSDYCRTSLLEIFNENQAHYPVLLPADLSNAAEPLAHLRLHNGTIWRWNRPLLGFDADGTPHLRIEHRVMPAGPTHLDALANAALFYGLMQYYIARPDDISHELPFATVRDNFYQCARHGLHAMLEWQHGTRMNAQQLLQNLLPLARQGLQQLAMAGDDIDDFMSILDARLHTGQTGAAWQRHFVQAHGNDMTALVIAYLAHQQQGNPVHEWTV